MNTASVAGLIGGKAAWDQAALIASVSVAAVKRRRSIESPFKFI
jgi:hypothetical protein